MIQCITRKPTVKLIVEKQTFSHTYDVNADYIPVHGLEILSFTKRLEMWNI